MTGDEREVLGGYRSGLGRGCWLAWYFGEDGNEIHEAHPSEEAARRWIKGQAKAEGIPRLKWRTKQHEGYVPMTYLEGDTRGMEERR